MKLMNLALILSLSLFACQKKNDDKKSNASKDGGATAAGNEKTGQRNKPGAQNGSGTEGKLLNSSKFTYTLAGGKKELEIKSTNSNSCVLFDTKFNEGQFSLNLNFADADNSAALIVKSNQSLLKDMFTLTVNNSEKKPATLDGMSNFQMGDGRLTLKVKSEEFTSENCDVSGKPRLYKTDYDVAGYELDITCLGVKQTGLDEEAQKKSDGQIKITAHCALSVQK